MRFQSVNRDRYKDIRWQHDVSRNSRVDVSFKNVYIIHYILYIIHYILYDFKPIISRLGKEPSVTCIQGVTNGIAVFSNTGWPRKHLTP